MPDPTPDADRTAVWRAYDALGELTGRMRAVLDEALAGRRSVAVTGWRELEQAGEGARALAEARRWSEEIARLATAAAEAIGRAQHCAQRPAQGPAPR